MTIEGNKEIARMLIKEVFENYRVELLEELLHEEFTTGELSDHSPKYRNHHHDKADYIKLWQNPIHKRSYEILDVIAVEDKIAVKCELTIRWLQGEMVEGKVTSQMVIFFIYFKDEKIIRYDEVYDKWARYLQLGIAEHMVNSETNRTLSDYIEQLEAKGYF